MSTERTHPYLFWGLLCAIAVSGLIIAVCLYPSVARYYFVKTNSHKIFGVVATGSVEDVKYFIERGVSVNEKPPRDMSLLHIAVRLNPDVNVMKYLIGNGADVNAKDDDGATPLHIVARYSLSNIEKAKTLIDNGADVNAKDNHGRIPLHFMASFSLIDLEVMKYLIEKGADVNAKDNDGATPLDYVIRHPIISSGAIDERKAILCEAGGKRGEELPE